jgi:hypothetical protein
MTARPYFRCHAYGLLSVAQCRANRAARLRLACVDCGQRAAVDAGTEPSLTTLAALAAPRPAPEPTPAWAVPPTSPMADVGLRAEVPLRSRPAPTPRAKKNTPAPAAPTPGENIAGPATGRSSRVPPAPVPSRRARGSVRAGALQALRDGPATPLQVAQHVGCMRQTAAKVLQRLAAAGRVVSAGGGAYALPAPPAKRASARVARLLKDLAARKIGLPEAVRRARGALKAAGRRVPRDTWETL